MTSAPPSEAVIEVTRADLPLQCPRPDATLWSAHPRVYLAVNTDKPVKCPYCGASYLLTA